MYTKQQKNQALNKTKLKDFYTDINNFNHGKAKVYNLLINQYYYFKGRLFISHHTIAAALGMSVYYVGEIIRSLKHDGYISYRHRFNNSNVYKLPDIFKDQTVVDSLVNVLPALRNVLCFSILLNCYSIANPFLCSQKAFTGKTQPILNNEYLLRNNSDLILDGKCTMHCSMTRQSAGYDNDGSLIFKKSLNTEETKPTDLTCESERKSLQRETCEPRTSEKVDMPAVKYRDSKAVEYFKRYVTVLLPQTIEELRKCGRYEDRIIEKLLKGQWDKLSDEDQQLLIAEGFQHGL